jgi:hypothetical protein
MKDNDTRLSSKADWSCLYTKDQLDQIVSYWPQATMPKKGQEVVIEFSSKHFTHTLARLSWTDKKGTYGDRLYSVEFWK